MVLVEIYLLRRCIFSGLITNSVAQRSGLLSSLPPAAGQSILVMQDFYSLVVPAESIKLEVFKLVAPLRRHSWNFVCLRMLSQSFYM